MVKMSWGVGKGEITAVEETPLPNDTVTYTITIKKQDIKPLKNEE